jgi:tRNA A37 methylthiotransferase MiaB
MVYIGIYSPRPGTQAHKHIPDNISYEIKHKRRDILNKLLIDISTKNNKAEV